MGYHVAVVRTLDGRKSPIQAEELQRFVEVHPDFRILRRASGKGAPLLVLAHHGLGSSISELQFDEQEGELWAKDPLPADIDVMLMTARALGGRVVGEDFQTFRTATDTYLHADDKAGHDAANAVNHAFLQRKRRIDMVRWCIRGGALAVLVLGLVLTWFKR